MLNKKLNSRTGLLFSLFCFLLAVFLNYFSSSSTEKLCKKAGKALHAKEEKAVERFELMGKMLEKSAAGKLFDLFEGSITELYNRENIALFAYENDSLKFWTTNEVALDSKAWAPEKDNGLVHLRNGWYEYYYKEKGNLKTFCLILLKPDYDVQNSYLNNSFVTWLDLPQTVKLKYPVSNKTYEIKSVRGESLFELSTDEVVRDARMQKWSLFFFLTGLVFCLFFGLKVALKREIDLPRFLILSIILLLLRVSMIWLKWPGLLYQTDLYDLSAYGNSRSFFNGFLGDILFNGLLLFCLSFLFYKKIHFESSKAKAIALPILFLSLLMFSFQLNSTIKSLVSDSANISFEFLNVFNLNWLSFLCLTIVFIFGLAILILVEKCIQWLDDIERKKRNIILWITHALYFVCYFFFLAKYFSAVESFWFLGLFDLAFILKNAGAQKSIIGFGLRLVAFSVIVSLLFGNYNSAEEKQDIQIMSDELSDRQDPVLESKFDKVARKISSDVAINAAIAGLPLNSSETEQMIRQTYFKGYFEKYTVQLALFDSLCLPFFKNFDQRFGNKENFEEQISDALPVSENLFFIENYKPNARYIGKIEFNKKNEHAACNLYVLLEPKLIADEGSFPDLLLEKYQQKKSQYTQFSYAIYKQNRLTNSYGEFDYPLYYGSEFALKTLSKDFKHFFSSPDSFTRIVLTTHNKDFQYYFTLNSYYFLFFSILGLLSFLVYSRMSDKLGLFSSLNRRIQLFIVSILFFALLAVGIFSIRLVSTKFEDDNIKALSDKTKRITSELTPLLFNSEYLNVNNPSYAEGLLKKYSELFKSDISLYDVNGHLFASSQPQLFELGLSSRLINPLVIANFKRTRGSHFNVPDNIGLLKYLSFYAAIYNPDGTFLGFMNLPYFARQSHLEKELSDYITTLLNIYVVLFLVSLFTGLIVTAYITKPLRIVQQQLAKISLNKKNEPISWKSNDEIGKLVNEYNLMLLKLEDSASLLARSEREGAWREMAKQVAHEIKNPLTPMKLNLQYLQKLVTENSEDFKKRFKPVSTSIIEQIDTLAHIANEFSNFAKMPKATIETINLTEVIESSIQLFENAENVNISFNSSRACFIKADREQCLRVFNNLIKNAVQSIPETRKGMIEIIVTDEDDTVLVAVKDNGCGISETMREKIFVPNFTTKSTGTGLGLAMVKNIVTSSSGTIWFESNENAGTIFYVRFQKSDIKKG